MKSQKCILDANKLTDEGVWDGRADGVRGFGVRQASLLLAIDPLKRLQAFEINCCNKYVFR